MRRSSETVFVLGRTNYMNRRLTTLLAAAALLTAVVAAAVAGTGSARSAPAKPATVPLGPGPEIPVAPAVNATNSLALKLLGRLGGDGNLVFSPYSIEAALAMVDQGAAGSTAAEIRHVLGGSGGVFLGESNRALSDSLSASVTPPQGGSAKDAAQLLVGNGLWVQQGLALASPFTSDLSQNFGAAPQTVDFAHNAPGARQAINGWIADHTAGLIRNLMGPSAITPQTALVLANAIYLKAHWASPFVKASTAPQPFTTTGGQRVSAPFMTQPSTSFGYARGKGYVAADLPYLDSHLSMLAVMPTPGTISGFERHLTPAAFGRLTGSLSTRLVNLRMPKLRLALQTDLAAALSSLGMPIAFTDRADFSGITSATSLKIAAVEHGADLKVDESGTVAAAATGISLTPTAVRLGPAVGLTLNHPYLLFLRDDDTGAILFAARVADPAQG
jgi:serpin B